MISVKNKQQLKLFLIIIFSFALTFSVTEANTVVRSGEIVSIEEGQVVDGDLYVAAGTANLSGEVAEDAVIAGGQITINGKLDASAFLLGGSVDVHGVVADDLRIIAGDTIVTEPVMGDLFVMGGSVNILSTASVTGDVIVFAGEAIISGSVGGDIIGTVGDLRIDTAVMGDVDVSVEQLTLGDRADIQGSVEYASDNSLTQALNATVVGELVRSDPIISKDKTDKWTWLVPSIILLFSALVWYLVSRKSLNLVINRALVKSPRPFLLGIFSITIVPFVIGVFLVSMIGSLVALVLLFSYALLLILSLIAMVPVLGQLSLMAFSKVETKLSLLSIVVGITGFILLSTLPLLGMVVLLIFVILTFGALVDLVIRPVIKKKDVT